jgi:hypothetical protein
MKASESMQVYQRFRQPRADLEILGLRGQSLGRQLDDLVPVGYFRLAFPLALLEEIIGAARLSNLIVQALVKQVGAGGIVAGDRCEELFQIDYWLVWHALPSAQAPATRAWCGLVIASSTDMMGPRNSNVGRMFGEGLAP